jgi:hypothetical protein
MTRGRYEARVHVGVLQEATQHHRTSQPQHGLGLTWHPCVPPALRSNALPVGSNRCRSQTLHPAPHHLTPSHNTSPAPHPG